MNSFSIVESKIYGEGIVSGNQKYGIIVLPYDKNYELIEDDAMLEIVKQWIELKYKNNLPTLMRIVSSIRGTYIADSGEIFNEASVCLLLSLCEVNALAELAIIIKNKSSSGLVLFQACGSHKIYGV
jgi:hypothetical protein